MSISEKGAALFKQLSSPFSANKVSWRVGSTNADKSKGMALCYIDSRDVMDRFNEVCGPFGWQCRHEVAPDGKKVTCHIGVLDPDTNSWVWRSDGAGETDVEGEKGSYSDSLKRSAVSFGVGRYLYDGASPWVALEPAGRSFKIAAGEYKRLEAILAKSAPSVSAPISHNTEPKPEQDQDPDGQAQNWVDQQVNIIKAAKTLPELTGWLDKVASDKDGRPGDLANPASGSTLRRLQSKAPALFAVVKAQYMQRLAMI